MSAENRSPEQQEEDGNEEKLQEDAAANGAPDAQPADSDDPDNVADLQTRADENWDRYLRAAAELDNVRKRAARDVENARKFALERFGGELLAVKDSLEMGLAAVEQADAEVLRQGSEATLKILANVLVQFGITEIDPQGEPFDPEVHEAMTMQPSADMEPGSVLTVFQKGYALNGRLLRPARVVVSAELPEAVSGDQK